MTKFSKEQATRLQEQLRHWLPSELGVKVCEEFHMPEEPATGVFIVGIWYKAMVVGTFDSPEKLNAFLKTCQLVASSLAGEEIHV